MADAPPTKDATASSSKEPAETTPPTDPAASSPTQPEPAPAPATTSTSTAPAPVSAAVASDDAGIEVDLDTDASDPGFDEQLSNFTASLSSSVMDYPVEHGRRYHAYRAGAYIFPNDERELDRLDMIHLVCTKAIGGKLHLAPFDKDKVQKILDIGTGSGTWATEMGDQYPNAEVIGNDLSPVQSSWVPPNVKFEVDDVESEWTYDFNFDYIFCRYMAASIADWPKLVERIYQNLAPGGWVEFEDFDLMYKSDDGSLTKDHYTYKWVDTIINLLHSIGRDCIPGKKLRKMAEEAGFVNIQETVIKIPFGPWPKDPHLKELGMLNVAQILEGLEGLSVKPLSMLGYSEEEVTVLVAHVRKELKSKAFHAYYTLHVVTGQKPE